MNAERWKRLQPTVAHAYVDMTTGVSHLDIAARLRALGRPTDAATVRRTALETFRQFRRIGGMPAAIVAHVRPMREL